MGQVQSAMSRPKALLINLGDFARSPRAANHLRCLKAAGWEVVVITTDFSRDLNPIQSEEQTRFVLLGGCERSAIAKTVHWGRGLYDSILLHGRGGEAIWLMAPPIVPAATILKSWRPRPRLFVDWHNTGSSRMVAKYGIAHPLTLFYRWLENRPWPRNTVHFAVSKALADHLTPRVAPGGRIITLHDLPVAATPCKPVSKNMWAQKWGSLLDGLNPNALWIACPTGWNDEERPEWILERLREFTRALPEKSRPLQIIMTGVGPRRPSLSRCEGPGGRVAALLGWLPLKAYHALLACSDAGLCLHTSTSGLDLPMKLADMRGAQLRACIFRYSGVLNEVYQEPQNGYFFDSPEDLPECLIRLLSELPAASQAPTQIVETWDEAWKKQVSPLLSA